MTTDTADRSDDSTHASTEDHQRTDGTGPLHAPSFAPLESTRRRALASNPVSEPITVCYVDGDPTFRDLVRTAFADDDRLEVRTESSLSAAIRQLDRIDCLVSGEMVVTGGGDGTGDGAGNGNSNENGNGTTTGNESEPKPQTEPELQLESLELVREHDPRLPVVYFVDEIHEAFLTRRCSTWLQWVDCLRKGTDETTMALLEYRIHDIVSRRQRSTLARRALVALETVQNGVAIVTPDGTFDFVDRVFAATFRTDPDDLLGQPWHTVYPDEEVDRLRTTALPTVDDGWRWTGRCTGTRTDGTAFTARTDIVGLEDSGLVFVLGGSAGSSDAGSSSS